MNEWRLSFDKCEIWLWWSINYNQQIKRCYNVFEIEDKHFFISVHCMAHRIILAAINTMKIPPCKEIFRQINLLSNLVVMHFKNSCKRKKIHFFGCKRSLLILQIFLKNTKKLGGKLWQPFVILYRGFSPIFRIITMSWKVEPGPVLLQNFTRLSASIYLFFWLISCMYVIIFILE